MNHSERAESRQFLNSDGLGAVKVLNKGYEGHLESNIETMVAPWAEMPWRIEPLFLAVLASIHVQVVLSFPLQLTPGFQQKVRLAWQKKVHVKMVPFFSAKCDLFLLNLNCFFFCLSLALGIGTPP